jgi:ferrochelatase
LISRRRAPEAAKGYQAMGGKSPIGEYTAAQAKVLDEALKPAGDYAVFVCMRYWHPMSDEVVQQLKQQEFEHVILLPLYPQYSTTTSGSSYNDFMRACRRVNYTPTLRFIEKWYNEPRYQDTIAEAIRQEANKLPDPNPENIEVLFSAHGLPQKIVKRGDPYQEQIEATYEAVKNKLGWPHTTLCYQSRVGPLEWLRPYTEDVILEKAKAGTKQMLVYPIAFVSDHIETLYELGVEYAEVAEEHGIEHYRVVPALNTDPGLIQTLKELVTAQNDFD